MGLIHRFFVFNCSFGQQNHQHDMLLNKLICFWKKTWFWRKKLFFENYYLPIFKFLSSQRPNQMKPGQLIGKCSFEIYSLAVLWKPNCWEVKRSIVSTWKNHEKICDSVYILIHVQLILCQYINNFRLPFK